MADEFDGPPWGEEEVLKDNLCHITFMCIDKYPTECVYYKDNGGRCKYSRGVSSADFSYCGSSTARVNKMVLEMKKMGL